MAEFGVNTNIFRIFESLARTLVVADTNWFDENITIKTSNDKKGTTIVVDFSLDFESVVSFTVDGGDHYTEFDEGIQIKGAQSRYVRLVNGSVFNIKSTSGGDINYAIVGEIG